MLPAQRPVLPVLRPCSKVTLTLNPAGISQPKKLVLEREKFREPNTLPLFVSELTCAAPVAVPSCAGQGPVHALLSVDGPRYFVLCANSYRLGHST